MAEIISKDSLLKDDKNWHPCGNNVNNFSFFQNQQSNSGSALIEKNNKFWGFYREFNQLNLNASGKYGKIKIDRWFSLTLKN